MPKKVEGGVSLGALGPIGLSPAARAARCAAGDSPISQGDKLLPPSCVWSLLCEMKWYAGWPRLSGWCLEEGAPHQLRCP